MKKALILALGLMVLASPAAAADKGAAAAEKQKKAEEIRQLVDDKRKELNGSQWRVKTGLVGQKGKESEDVLTFQNDQVRSENLGKRGFIPTNYTVTVPEGQVKDQETAVFETMQTGPKGEIAFIRGEWKEKFMQGSINEQREKEPAASYWFSSKSREKIAPTTAAEKKGEAAPAAAIEKEDETYSGTTDVKKILKSEAP